MQNIYNINNPIQRDDYLPHADIKEVYMYTSARAMIIILVIISIDSTSREVLTGR